MELTGLNVRVDTLREFWVMDFDVDGAVPETNVHECA